MIHHNCTLDTLEDAFKHIGRSGQAHKIVWDHKIPYFGVKVMWSGTMTAVYRTMEPDRLKKICRITDENSLDEARDLAWSRYMGDDDDDDD